MSSCLHYPTIKSISQVVFLFLKNSKSNFFASIWYKKNGFLFKPIKFIWILRPWYKKKYDKIITHFRFAHVGTAYVKTKWGMKCLFEWTWWLVGLYPTKYIQLFLQNKTKPLFFFFFFFHYFFSILFLIFHPSHPTKYLCISNTHMNNNIINKPQIACLFQMWGFIQHVSLDFIHAKK